MSTKTRCSNPSVLSAVKHPSRKSAADRLKEEVTPAPVASSFAPGATFSGPTETELHCPICSKRGFTTPAELLSHANDSHKVSEKRFPCNVCRLSGFCRRTRLNAHQKNGRCMGSWDITWLEQNAKSHSEASVASSELSSSVESEQDRSSEKENRTVSSHRTSLRAVSTKRDEQKPTENKNELHEQKTTKNHESLHAVGAPLVTKSSTSKVNAPLKEQKTVIVNRSRHSVPNGFMTEHTHISQKRKRSPSVVHGNISSTEGIHSPPSKTLKLDGSRVRTQSQAPVQTTPSGSISNGLSHLSPTSSGLPARRSLLDWDSFISIPKKTRRLSLQPQMQPHSANGPSTTDHFPHNSPVTARADPNDVKSSPVNPLRSPNNHHSHPSKEAKQTGAKSSGGPLTSAGSLLTQTKHPKAISGNVVNKDWQKLFDEMSPPDDEEKQGIGRKSFSSTEDNNSVIRKALPGIVEDFSDLECGPYPEGTSQIWSSDRISSDSSPTTSVVLKPEMLLSKEKTADSNERRKKVSQQRLIPKSQRGHSTQPVDVDVPPNVVICSAPNKIEESDEITPNVETEEQPIHMRRLSAAEDDVSPQTAGKWEVQSLESVKMPTTGIALSDPVATCSSENNLKQPPADQSLSSGSPCRPPPTSTSYRIESSPKKMDAWSSNEPDQIETTNSVTTECSVQSPSATESHLSGVSDQLLCSLCGRVFRKLGSLKVHQTFCKDMPSRTEPIDQTETLNSVVSESDASLPGTTESCHPSVLDVLSCSGCDRVFAKPGYLKVHQVSCKKYHSKTKGHVESDNLPLTPTVLKSEVHSSKEKLPDSDEGKRKVLEQQLIRKSQRRRSNRSADVDVPPNADICSTLDGAVGDDKVTASNSEIQHDTRRSWSPSLTTRSTVSAATSKPESIAPHSSKRVKSFACPGCQRRFKREGHLSSHLLRFHCSQRSNISDRSSSALTTMPIAGTSNQHDDRPTKPLITAPPHLKSPAYFRRYPCPYCSRRFWKPEHMEGHLTRCTRRSTRTGLKRRRTDVASPNSMPLEAKGIYGFRPRAVSEPRGKVSRKQQTPVDTPTCVSVPNEQHVQLTRGRPRIRSSVTSRPSNSTGSTSPTTRMSETSQSRTTSETYRPSLRMRIRLTNDVRRGRPSLSVVSSHSSGDRSTFSTPRSLRIRSSRDNRASSVDDARSTISDATTLPAVKSAHSVKRSRSTTTHANVLSCSWCLKSNFSSVKIWSAHRSTCAARRKSTRSRRGRVDSTENDSHTRSRSEQTGTRAQSRLCIRLWVCDHCGTKFRSRSELRAHKVNRCSPEGRHRRSLARSSTEPKSVGQTQPVKGMLCPGCPKLAPSFDSTEAVLQHILSLKPTTHSSSAARLSGWPAPLAVPNLGFGCYICGLLLASESRLDKHKREVHEEWLQEEQKQAISPKKKKV